MFKRIFVPILLGLLGLTLLAALAFEILLHLPLPEPLLPNEAHASVLVKDVHVVDLEADTLIQHQHIWIESGRISFIGSLDSLQVPEGTHMVEAQGAYALPTLWDMHTHLLSSQAPQLNMPLFMAAGVTHIRDLGEGAPQALKNEWIEKIDEGSMLGPRIESKAAFILNYLKDEADAVKWVEKVEDPQDFIKTYNSLLPKPYDKMAEEAKRRGIDFLGHKPRSISTAHAAKMGQKSFEHARLFLYDCFSGSEALQEEYRARISGEKEGSGPIVDRKMRQRMVDEHDPQMFADLVEVLKETGAWYVPTHITRKMDAYADDENFINDPRLKYISFPQQFAWKQDAQGMVARDPSEAGRKAYKDFYEKGLELSGEGYKMGLKMLAGTDANDTYCIPGLGLHDELAELVKGGLKPHEALLTATRNPAQYYGIEEEIGTISLGKMGDMILLDQNPLEDIKHIGAIHTLIHQGSRVYTKDDLDAMLNYVEENAGSASIAVKLTWEKI